MSSQKKVLRAKEQELVGMQHELHNLQCTLDDLYARFDQITDGAQVEACIYEINAVISKYDYTMKCLKAFDVS